MRVSILACRPGVTVFLGAISIAFSGILFRLAHVSPSTGAFFRCLWALPPLYAITLWERRRWGKPVLRARAFAWLAGLFFTADLILWHTAIEKVGAGLATVLGNTQVVLVGLLAWLLFSERPHRSSLAAIPVVTFGVLLISGVLEHGAYGSNPGLGTVYGILTGFAYTGFLLVLRFGQRGVVGPAGPLFDATLACTLGCVVVGEIVGDLDFTPSWSAQGWLVLLALSSQVWGWLLIAISLPRLPAVVTSVSLTFQPLCSVLFAALILGESPSALQLLGTAAILSGLVIASFGRRQSAVTLTPAPSSAASASRILTD
ncbi:MAG TPA: DMT family transporter [Gaiellaceae bacterium]|nr:DMT family transporter [Gaiellaceae bacterium]